MKQDSKALIDGLSQRQGKRLLRLFARDDVLLFSDGESEIDVSDPRVRAIYVSVLGAELLFIRRGARPMRTIPGWAGESLKNALNDPTYDRLDLELDRFLLACTRIINDKSRHPELVKRWAGPRP